MFFKNNKQEKLEMIALQQVNKLIMKSKTTQTSQAPRPYTSLRVHQICMSDLYVVHRIFLITPEDKLQDQ